LRKWKFPDEYIHYSKQVFNTGLELEIAVFAVYLLNLRKNTKLSKV